MKHKLMGFILCCALAATPLTALAQTAADVGLPALPANTTAFISLKGEQTAGITFTVYDVYFDGALLTLTIRQGANDPDTAVYEDEISNLDEAGIREMLKEPLSISDKAVGAYCDAVFYDEQGKEVVSDHMGEGFRDGRAIVESISMRFPLEELHDRMTVRLGCGVVETPGRTEDAAWATLELTALADKTVQERTVKIVKDEKEAPSFSELVIRETDEVAAVYAYYTLKEAGVSFVNETDEEMPGSAIGGCRDDARGLYYDYHTVRKSAQEPLKTVTVYDRLTWKNYVINLEDGTASIAD